MKVQAIRRLQHFAQTCGLVHNEKSPTCSPCMAITTHTMPHNYTILVGTMTGTAEIVAEEIKLTLEGAGAAVMQLSMADLNATVFERAGRFIICTSTYGSGD